VANAPFASVDAMATAPIALDAIDGAALSFASMMSSGGADPVAPYGNVLSSGSMGGADGSFGFIIAIFKVLRGWYCVVALL
jgi:hypothetical protein